MQKRHRRSKAGSTNKWLSGSSTRARPGSVLREDGAGNERELAQRARERLSAPPAIVGAPSV